MTGMYEKLHSLTLALQSSHKPSRGGPAGGVRLEAVPSAAALVCSGGVTLSSFWATHNQSNAQGTAKPATSFIPNVLVCCISLVMLPASSFQMAFLYL